jgi:hypothetical protein
LTVVGCDGPEQILAGEGEDVSGEGLQLQHLAIDVRPDLEEMLISKLKSLTPLTSLHLTFDEILSLHMTQALQDFCSAIFQHMFDQRACFSLKAIVMGHNVYPGSVNADAYCTRHCFIRDYERNAQKTKAIAVMVPAYRIHELEPDCDMLDFDPRCESLGSFPGRLQF